MRNLGIVSSFQVGQKLDLLQTSDYVWQQGLEPERASELATYKYKYLKLDLRYEPSSLSPLGHRRQRGLPETG